MSDYVNDSVPVADGVLEGVVGNQAVVYPWMSVKAGAPSYFKELRMLGDLYDKNGVAVAGGYTPPPPPYKLDMHTADLEDNSVQLITLAGGPPIDSFGTFNGAIDTFNTSNTSGPVFPNASMSCVIGNGGYARVSYNLSLRTDQKDSNAVGVRFYFEIDGGGIFGRTEIKLPPVGDSVSVSFSATAQWATAGGYLGRLMSQVSGGGGGFTITSASAQAQEIFLP